MHFIFFLACFHQNQGHYRAITKSMPSDKQFKAKPINVKDDRSSAAINDSDPTYKHCEVHKTQKNVITLNIGQVKPICFEENFNVVKAFF